MSTSSDDIDTFIGAQSWPRTVVLHKPIEFGKETITELVFQQGNLGIIKGLSLPVDRIPNFDEAMVLAARLCGRPLKVIESLDPDDVQEVMAIALGFFGRCLGAGKKRSPS